MAKSCDSRMQIERNSEDISYSFACNLPEISGVDVRKYNKSNYSF